VIDESSSRKGQSSDADIPVKKPDTNIVHIEPPAYGQIDTTEPVTPFYEPDWGRDVHTEPPPYSEQEDAWVPHANKVVKGGAIAGVVGAVAHGAWQAYKWFNPVYQAYRAFKAPQIWV